MSLTARSSNTFCLQDDKTTSVLVHVESGKTVENCIISQTNIFSIWYCSNCCHYNRNLCVTSTTSLLVDFYFLAVWHWLRRKKHVHILYNAVYLFSNVFLHFSFFPQCHCRQINDSVQIHFAVTVFSASIRQNYGKKTSQRKMILRLVFLIYYYNAQNSLLHYFLHSPLINLLHPFLSFKIHLGNSLTRVLTQKQLKYPHIRN